MKFLVMDTGLSLEHSIRLAKDGNQVLYYTHWSKAFPKFADFAIGLGFTELEKVLYPFDVIDDVDAVIFFDIGSGDLANRLRNKGYTVYGAGQGEKLENHRSLLKRIQKKLNLPSQKWDEIRGLDNLREFLKNNNNKYVKLDIFRGDIESFYAKNYKSIELYLNEIQNTLGPFSDSYSFIVEDKVEGIEPGFDLYFNGQEFLKPYLWGFEHSKSAYIGKYVDQLPAPLDYLMKKFQPVLQQMDYRGAVSVETIVTDKGVPYMIDFCARYPFPLSAVYTESIKNYSEVIYKIAQKQPVTLDIAGKYVGALPLDSTHAENNWTKIIFDPKLRNKIKFRLAAARNNDYYSVKGLSTVVVLVSVGNSVASVIKDLEETAEKVDAFGLTTEQTGNLHKIYELLRESPKYNLPLL